MCAHRKFCIVGSAIEGGLMRSPRFEGGSKGRGRLCACLVAKFLTNAIHKFAGF